MERTWFEELIESSKGSLDYKYEKITLTVTETIVNIMRRKGWNKKELARRLDVKPSYITKLLNGTNLTIRQMLRICEVLGCNLDIDITETAKSRAGIVVDWEHYIKNRHVSLEGYKEISNLEEVKADVITA